MDKKKTEMCIYLHKNRETTIDKLSKVFNKTNRAIRNDIEEINVFLRHICANLIVVENGVVYTNLKEINIREYLNNLDYYEYTLDSTERDVVIILYAMTKKNMFTINDLLEFMKVSRSTVMKDINKVKSFISIYNNELISLASKGIILKEINSKFKYDLIIDLLKFDLDNVIRFFNQNEYLELDDERISYKEYISLIDDVLEKTEEDSGKKLTEYSYNILKYFLSLYLLLLEKSENQNLSNSSKGDFIYYLVQNLDNKFEININDIDRHILRRLLDSLNFENKKYKNNDLPKIQIITRKFIEDISSKISIDLNFDEELLKNLSKHLSSILNAKAEKLEEYNFIDEIIEENPDLYKIVKESIGEINKIANRKLNDTEISFILIYLIAAIEKQKNLIRNINLLIICAAGVGTSYFIKEKIKNVVPYANIYISNTQNYRKFLDKENIDIVLSNVKIAEEFDYLFIKNILDDDFIEDLITEIDEIKLKKIKSGSKKTEIYDITEKTKELDNKLDLSDILKPEFMRFEIEAKDWKDSIVKSSRILLENDIIEERYTDAMIKNIEEYGPYIVVSKGVAIPHASSEEGVKKTAMSLIKLKNPVPFGVEGLDPIQYVISLSSLNNEHFYAFFDLVNGLQNEEIKQEFISANSSSDMEKVLKKMEDLT
ncbi:BglG family transcription antiterminator [Helcococcus kunzii]|uniref:BglG family transcription antiterminator n=1 Tax=Helcococcus kunzii TaxID=40091 RepID=UPI0021A8C630|nr:PTS sugar transporter subunit IIA [Helcococcus kunzii]MCT1796522.1 PTS sugar transporter subunit IIA [Helcococcus kunzii]MCT1988334.1 PTS sugar transporter subunit IIA [Helcococcus kunzii]